MSLLAIGKLLEYGTYKNVWKKLNNEKIGDLKVFWASSDMIDSVPEDFKRGAYRIHKNISGYYVYVNNEWDRLKVNNALAVNENMKSIYLLRILAVWSMVLSAIFITLYSVASLFNYSLFNNLGIGYALGIFIFLLIIFPMIFISMIKTKSKVILGRD